MAMISTKQQHTRSQAKETSAPSSQVLSDSDPDTLITIVLAYLEKTSYKFNSRRRMISKSNDDDYSDDDCYDNKYPDDEIVFKEYDFVSNPNWSQSQLKEQEKNLKYITKRYGCSLKKLGLRSCLPNKIIEIIKTKCYNIEKLEISLHENQTKQPFLRNLFNDMIHLTTLKINWNFVTETLPMTLVESLQQTGGTLKELNISCQLYRNRTVMLPDSLISVFPFLIALEKLSLIDFRLDQKIIDSIANIGGLIYLNLSTEFYGSIVDMNAIGNLEKLEALILKTDEGDKDIFLL